MTQRTSTPAPREDWRIWLPDGAAEPQLLMPRAELLAKVAEAQQVRISERELRYWEAIGALPAPVLRHQAGALRALYPVWHHSIVAQVPALRAQGLGWDAVRKRTRDQFQEDALARSRIMEAEDLGGYRGAPPSMSPELVAAMRAFLTQAARETGVPIPLAWIDLVDNSGQHQLRYRITTAPDEA